MLFEYDYSFYINAKHYSKLLKIQRRCLANQTTTPRFHFTTLDPIFFSYLFVPFSLKKLYCTHHCSRYVSFKSRNERPRWAYGVGCSKYVNVAYEVFLNDLLWYLSILYIIEFRYALGAMKNDEKYRVFLMEKGVVWKAWIRYRVQNKMPYVKIPNVPVSMLNQPHGCR